MSSTTMDWCSYVILGNARCLRKRATEVATKSFLLLKGDAESVPHEYERILKERAEKTRLRFIASLVESGQLSSHDEVNEAISTISNNGLTAECDALLKSEPNAPRAHARHEPYVVVGTQGVSELHKLRLAFAGYVAGKMKRYRPTHGFIVTCNGDTKRFALERLNSTIRSVLTELREMIDQQGADGPPLVLNEHCPVCQFRQHCQQQAEEEDNLSLLDRMTPKLERRYKKKGIFTVSQLSYLYKPRRRRKRTAVPLPHFNVELQALALRTGKIYLHEPPSIPEHPIELFLDIEGIPDEGFQYLIGLLVRDNDRVAAHSFWADSLEDESAIFHNCLDLIAQYPNGPVYHYGNYETKAFAHATSKYGLDSLKDRLVNVNSFVFGKVYFPARSNRLKDIGSLVGANWRSLDASGLQSLVWRYHWEQTQDDELKQLLLDYNQSDCNAVYLLVDELRKIEKTANSRSDIDFADSLKQQSTEAGKEIHLVLEGILTSAHYQRNRIRIRSPEQDNTSKKAGGAPKGCRAIDLRRIPAKGGKIVRVPRRRTCPRHKNTPLKPSDNLAEHVTIDLAFTTNGCRKTTMKYAGRMGYCPKCRRDYRPNIIRNLSESQVFGRSFRTWTTNQRIALRLPYEAISQEIEDLFGETIHTSTLAYFVRRVAEEYVATESALMQRILDGGFVHVDETTISIKGVRHYAWVLTNGQHVVFRLTATREATMITDLLDGYSGVLVSDFYGGYDSVVCKHQRCLVHLIRDLNDDLWKNPFNQQFESFVSSVRDLLIPIFDDVGKYGLKTRNLRKHVKRVDRFRKTIVEGPEYACEVTAKYHQRFRRYLDEMFTFLHVDGIPWNNNTAERAIRHLAVQRKISGSFAKRGAVDYLRLLGIHQTCRFQGKSFLRFLLSEEKGVDDYKERTRRSSRNR